MTKVVNIKNGNISVVFIILILIQCGRPVQNEFDENEEALLNEEKLDSDYYYLFKQGKFDEIVSRWEEEDRFIKDTLAFIEYRKSIYYISLVETSQKADLSLLLKEFDDDSYARVDFGYPRFKYRKKLLDDASSYMLNAILIYDFLNYKRYAMNNYDLYIEARIKLNSKKETNELLELESHLRNDERKSNKLYFDSLRLVYPHWSYIDSLEKYIDLAESYSNYDL